jgi:hypothetical protein
MLLRLLIRVAGGRHGEYLGLNVRQWVVVDHHARDAEVLALQHLQPATRLEPQRGVGAGYDHVSGTHDEQPLAAREAHIAGGEGKRRLACGDRFIQVLLKLKSSTVCTDRRECTA